MLRLAALSARGRLGAFTGALVALFAAAVLSMAWGMQLESILRTHAPVERYAAAVAVVTGQQEAGRDVLLGERVRVSSARAERLAAMPGVRAAVGDVSVPAQLGGRAVVAHGWTSAALTPYVLTAGRLPVRPDEVVAGYPAMLGARLPLEAAGPARTVTVVGAARPSHTVSQQTAIFLTDAEATRLAGHPGLVDAIGVLAAPGFDVSRLRAAAGGAPVLMGAARGAAEYPELERTRTVLIPVTAAFGGLAMFIAIFVVASTLGLSIQQREREIALLRARDRAGPGARARAVGSRHHAAELRPPLRLASCRRGDRRRGRHRAARGPGRRAARRPRAADPRAYRRRSGAAAAGTRAGHRRADRTRRRGPAVRGLDHHHRPADSRADIRDQRALSRGGGRLLRSGRGVRGRPAAGAGAHDPLPRRGFLASANLGAATRRFSSASTPLVLTVAVSCTFFFGFTTMDHAISQQQRAALTGQLAITSAGPGLPAAALADARATPGVRSAVAMTSTTLGPSLGVSSTLPAQILTGGQDGGLDVDATSGSLSALHGDTIALGRHVASAAGARTGDRVAVMLGDGTPAHATVVAIYNRDLAFGDALLSPELAAGHQTTPLLSEILIEASQPAAAVATRLQALARRYPGLHVSDSASLITANDASNELNHWLGPFFVAMIFAFTSIAVLNTLVMIALRRRRELALLWLTGATKGQVRSMARWEAILIIAIGLGIGLAIAATALLPLSHAFTGGLRPYAPAGWFAAILGASARCWP